MKKSILTFLLSCVSCVAFAQATVPTQKVIETVERNIMSTDVAYTAKPIIKTIQNGFQIDVANGFVKNARKVPVDAFSFTMLEDGQLGEEKRYKVQLNKLSEIFPSLEYLVKEQNVSYTGINYIGQFVPALGFAESQQLTVDGLNIPFAETNSNFSVGKIVFNDVSELLSDIKVKQENKLSLNDVTISHPLAKAQIQSLEMALVMPEVSKSTTPLEQVLSTPTMKESLSLKGVSLSSALVASETVSFDMDQYLIVNQNQSNLNLDANLKLDITNFKTTKQGKLPSALSVDVNATGFTLAEALIYSGNTNKLAENEMLPNSARKEIIKKNLQAEVDKAYNDLIDNMVITINDISVRGNEYAIVLKGKAIIKDENFKGTLQVTNFDYLAPTPKVIDETACQALVDKMLAGEVKGEEFQTQYNNTCEDGAGVLEFLRPYATTATKIKDAQGKDALLFDIQFAGEALFINNQKVDESVYSAPLEMLD